MDPDKRDQIRRRLAKLMRLAERATYEHEALAAAEAAARLMADHGLAYTTVADVEAETFTTDRRPWFRGAAGRTRAGRKPPVRFALPGISALCGVEHAWHDHDGTLLFFGTEAEVEVAHYFVALIGRTIEAEWARYAATKPPRGYSRVTSGTAFKAAMACRINERLEEMAAGHAPTAGTGLVALKNATVRSEFEARYAPKSRSARLTVRDYDAASAGYAAGSRADLHRGMRSDRDAVPAIEDRRDAPTRDE